MILKAQPIALERLDLEHPEFQRSRTDPLTIILPSSLKILTIYGPSKGSDLVQLQNFTTPPSWKSCTTTCGKSTTITSPNCAVFSKRLGHRWQSCLYLGMGLVKAVDDRTVFLQNVLMAVNLELLEVDLIATSLPPFLTTLYIDLSTSAPTNRNRRSNPTLIAYPSGCPIGITFAVFV